MRKQSHGSRGQSTAAEASAIALDRIWFERNRRRRIYLRRLIPGELPLPDDMPPGFDPYVIVYQVRPGTRARTPIFLPDDETGGPGMPRWSEDDMLACVPAIYLRL